MHYANGQPAQLGDVVKGVPYNSDQPRVVVGTVIGLNDSPHQSIWIAFDERVPFGPDEQRIQRDGIISADASFILLRRTEYGECGNFELVHRDPAEISAPVTAGEIEEVNDSSPVEEGP